MTCSFLKGTRVFAALCLACLAPLTHATTLQRMTFEDLTDGSDEIVIGKVTRSWSAWDAGHHYIWTHYSVRIASVEKGTKGTTIELSEPGGVAEGMGMTIAGSVSYQIGDSVLVFAQRMPNGMLRTTGWGQGKYTVDAQGKLHAEVPTRGVDYVDTKTPGTSLSTLEGMTIQEASLKVAARVRLTAQKGKVQ